MYITSFTFICPSLIDIYRFYAADVYKLRLLTIWTYIYTKLQLLLTTAERNFDNKPIFHICRLMVECFIYHLNIPSLAARESYVPHDWHIRLSGC